LPTSASCKDKRALVLFLFGGLLMAVDIFPGHDDTVAMGYAVRSQGATRVMVVGTGDKGPGHGEIPLDPSKMIGPEIPARYALFLHQPLAINRAEKSSLELLPGVGPYLAEAIVAAIAEHGPFSGPDDLQKVAGIGPKTRERLLPLIHFR
jgi:competence ComEA-like helix-hairpin-helix protein